MNIESFRELVKSLDKFLPFSPGEDPVLWAQVNTVVRIQDYLQKMTDTENLNLGNLRTEVECDHMTGVMFWANGARFAYASENLGFEPWPFCPKCGEKL